MYIYIYIYEKYKAKPARPKPVAAHRPDIFGYILIYIFGILFEGFVSFLGLSLLSCSETHDWARILTDPSCQHQNAMWCKSSGLISAFGEDYPSLARIECNQINK